MLARKPGWKIEGLDYIISISMFKIIETYLVDNTGVATNICPFEIDTNFDMRNLHYALIWNIWWVCWYQNERTAANPVASYEERERERASQTVNLNNKMYPLLWMVKLIIWCNSCIHKKCDRTKGTLPLLTLGQHRHGRQQTPLIKTNPVFSTLNSKLETWNSF